MLMYFQTKLLMAGKELRPTWVYHIMQSKHFYRICLRPGLQTRVCNKILLFLDQNICCEYSENHLLNTQNMFKLMDNENNHDFTLKKYPLSGLSICVLVYMQDRPFIKTSFLKYTFTVYYDTNMCMLRFGGR